jgi:hypothetical protein
VIAGVTHVRRYILYLRVAHACLLSCFAICRCPSSTLSSAWHSHVQLFVHAVCIGGSNISRESTIWSRFHTQRTCRMTLAANRVLCQRDMLVATCAMYSHCEQQFCRFAACAYMLLKQCAQPACLFFGAAVCSGMVFGTSVVRHTNRVQLQ